jgi:hypothetical protein
MKNTAMCVFCMFSIIAPGAWSQEGAKATYKDPKAAIHFGRTDEKDS